MTHPAPASNAENIPNSERPSALHNLDLRCPPLPRTLLDAMELVKHHESVTADRVIELVRDDPLVVARLMQVVNSAYYGARRTLSSVDRAVVLLGPVSVTGIIVGMNILKLRTAMGQTGADCFHRLIRHSAATAFLTRYLFKSVLARTTGPLSDAQLSESYSAALLHDFGKIILVYNHPEEAIALYENKALAGQVTDHNMRYLEQLLFGCDHTEAGEYAARKLSFPDLFTTIIRSHHDKEHSNLALKKRRLLRVIAAANVACRPLGHAFGQKGTWEDCLESPHWQAFADEDTDMTSEELIAKVKAQKNHVDEHVGQLTQRPHQPTHNGLLGKSVSSR